MEQLNSRLAKNAGKVSKKINIMAVAVLAAVVSLSSCRKDDLNSPSLKLNNDLALTLTPGGSSSLTDADGTVSRGNGADSSIYTVTNFFVDQGIYDHPDSVYHRANGNYYFDFSINDNVLGANSTTDPTVDWDLKFNGTGNADITANISDGAQIKYINQSFATTVASASSASTLWNTDGIAASSPFGYNRGIQLPPAYPYTPIVAADSLAAGYSINGWWNYYFPSHVVIAAKDITILVKDTAGDLYILGMVSVYENDDPDPAPGNPGAPYPTNYSYLTFKYQKRGTI